MSDKPKPSYHYIGKTDEYPFDLDDAERRRFFQIAEWYAAACKADGREPPRGPWRAVLEAAEMMHKELMGIAQRYAMSQGQDKPKH